MRGSEKPCPGCGQTKSWRKASEVCSDCKRLLKRANWMEEQLSKLGDAEVVVAIGKYDYWNEYLYTRSRSNINREIMSLFQKIAKAASRPALTHHAEYNLLGEIESCGQEYIVMPSVLAEAVKDLRIAVQKALADEYEAGKSDGHNLLMRLANGDLGPNEYMQKTG